MALSGVYEIFNERWCKQTVWLYSDPHFSDEDLRTGMPNRPSDEELVKMINSCVGRKDTIIFLGDIGDIEYARQIRGYKVLICGNHDVGHTVYNEVFDEVYSGPLMIGEKLLLSHEPVEVPWAFNIHGHIHDSKHKNDERHFNVCSDAIDYVPINMNQLMKQGCLSHIESIHRTTINKAIERKKKRGGRSFNNHGQKR